MTYKKLDENNIEETETVTKVEVYTKTQLETMKSVYESKLANIKAMIELLNASK